VKHAAQVELEKAMGETPRKSLFDTVMVRSFKNKFKDTLMQWKNLISYMKYNYYVKKSGGKNDD
jgi:hypothetical protein